MKKDNSRAGLSQRSYSSAANDIILSVKNKLLADVIPIFYKYVFQKSKIGYTIYLCRVGHFVDRQTRLITNTGLFSFLCQKISFIDCYWDVKRF